MRGHTAIAANLMPIEMHERHEETAAMKTGFSAAAGVITVVVVLLPLVVFAQTARDHCPSKAVRFI